MEDYTNMTRNHLDHSNDGFEKASKSTKSEDKAEAKKEHDENRAKTEETVHAKVAEHETKSGKSEMGEREKNEKMTEEMIKLHEKLGDKSSEVLSKEEVKKIYKEMQKEYGIDNGITGYGQIDDHIAVYIEYYDVIKNLPEIYQNVRVEYIVTGKIKA